MKTLIRTKTLNPPHFREATIVTHPSGDNDFYLVDLGRGEDGVGRMNSNNLQNQHVPDTRPFFSQFKSLNPVDTDNAITPPVRE